MLFSGDIESWNDIVNQSYDMEFDFIAIDNCNQIGVFSTFNRSYTPKCVTHSFNRFILLDKFIERLPKIATASFALENINDSSYTDWKHYAELGLFAYDNQTVHRSNEDQKHQYDIIFRPVKPLSLNGIPELAMFSDIVPRFNLTFGHNIKFKTLQAALADDWLINDK